MKVSEIRELLNAGFACGEEYADREVHSACGSDMMSDVLAYVKNQAVLLTGLVNPQVIRTADMMDMKCIVLVRGKTPTNDMIRLAEEYEIALLTTEREMFTACGILYGAGLRGRLG